MSETPTKTVGMQGLMPVLMGTLITVMSTWGLVRYEIRDRVDMHMPEITDKVSEDVAMEVSGLLLTKLDSIHNVFKRNCNCPEADKRALSATNP